MARLEMSLLGPPQILRDGCPVPSLATGNACALLAFLAVEVARPHRRDALAGLLWPDSPPERARHSLRQALSTLRRALGDKADCPPVLVVAQDTVQFNSDSDHRLDVAMLDSLLAQCDQHPHRRSAGCLPCLKRMERVTKLYRGEFLAGFSIANSPEFETWSLLTRERLQRAALDTLARMAFSYESYGMHEQALAVARRQLELDPWREAAHRQVMRALFLGGDRAAAVAQFERCRRTLAAELDVEPTDETTALYERIRTTQPDSLGAEERRPHRLESTSNLPQPLTPLVGRERVLTGIENLLADPACRLVTLVGPGGVGKTRLALEIATHLIGSFADGVHFISLAALRDPGLVAPSVALTLGLRECGEETPLKGLIAFLRDKQLLLVLDNFETVADAAPMLPELLAACPELKMLVTSRAALRVSAEHRYPVFPLDLPDPEQPPEPEDLGRYGATRLFMERARSTNPDFCPTGVDAPVVADICHRLDGLPLAIELAATRVTLLPLQALLARLEHRLPLLTGGARDLPARQRTLRDTIRWSYDLLHEPERRLFRRLAVCADGCTFPAAEAVGDAVDAPEMDMLDHLGTLIDQSMLRQQDDPSGDPRFAMLETVREYAQEQLAASGDEEITRSAHAAYYLAFAEEAAPKLAGGGQGLWLERLEADHNNLRVALRWLVDLGEADRAHRLGGALWRFWAMRGHLSEGRRWLDEILALAGGHSVPGRVNALNGAGQLSWCQADFGRAAAFFEEGLALARRRDDNAGIATALNGLGRVGSYSRGDHASARAMYEEALIAHRAAGSPWGAAKSLYFLGVAAAFQGDYDAAKPQLAEALTIFREVGDQEAVADSVGVMGMSALGQGDRISARPLIEEACAIMRSLGNRPGIAKTLSVLGDMALVEGDHQQADGHYAEALEILKDVQDRWWIAWCIEGVAGVAAARNQPVHGARLLGAAAALRAAINAPQAQIHRACYERGRTAVRSQLSPASFIAAWDRGYRMTPEEALAAPSGRQGEA